MHLKEYTPESQQFDQAIAKKFTKIIPSANKIYHYSQKNYEFLYFLSKDDLKVALEEEINDKTLFKRILDQDYIHIFDFLMDKYAGEFYQIIKDFIQDIDDEQVGKILFHAIRSGQDELALRFINILKARNANIKEIITSETRHKLSLFAICCRKKNIEILNQFHHLLNAEHFAQQLKLFSLNQKAYHHFLQAIALQHADLSIKIEVLHHALFNAVKNHDIENVKWLLQLAEIDINRPDKDGKTVLHLASSANDFAMVKLLTEQPAIDINRQDNKKMNALHAVVYQSTNADAYNIVNLLIQRGIHIDQIDAQGNTPLLYATWKDLSHIVKILLQARANYNFTDNAGDTPLHNALLFKGLESARHLCNAGCRKDQKNLQGNTPLHLAVGAGNAELVKLVMIPTTLNLQNNVLNTPLHLAVNKDFHEIIELLCKSGANLHCLNKDGKSAFQLAIEKRTPNINSVKFLFNLLNPNQNLEITPDSALAFYAITNNYFNYLNALPNRAKEQALNEAGNLGSINLVKQFLNHLNRKDDITAIWEFAITHGLLRLVNEICTTSPYLGGNTINGLFYPAKAHPHIQNAFHLAVRENQIEIVNYLLNNYHDIDFNQKDPDDYKTAFTIILEKKDSRLLFILLNQPFTITAMSMKEWAAFFETNKTNVGMVVPCFIPKWLENYKNLLLSLDNQREPHGHWYSQFPGMNNKKMLAATEFLLRNLHHLQNIKALPDYHSHKAALKTKELKAFCQFIDSWDMTPVTAQTYGRSA